jgi:hypothetical protein
MPFLLSSEPNTAAAVADMQGPHDTLDKDRNSPLPRYIAGQRVDLISFGEGLQCKQTGSVARFLISCH